MNKKVTYAKLHDGFFIPGVGNMKDTLPPDNKTLSEFKMELQEGGALLLQWCSFVGANKVYKRYLIGAATVKGAFLEDEIVPRESA